MPNVLILDMLTDGERVRLAAGVRRLRELERSRDAMSNGKFSLFGWLARHKAAGACCSQSAIIHYMVQELASRYDCNNWDARSLSVPDSYSPPWWHVFEIIARSGFRM